MDFLQQDNYIINNLFANSRNIWNNYYDNLKK